MCRTRCGPGCGPRAFTVDHRREPMFCKILLGAFLVAAGASVALGHITLENQQAAVGASYKAVLRVPHGCEGSATVAVRVRIPEGFIEVKPMPKPGRKPGVVGGQ